MRTAVRAGFAYFAVVFAAGFALGALRVLVLVPRIGEFLAVLAELPVMLAVSLVAARWAVRRFAVAAAAGPRLAMGGLAFCCLMVAEVLLAVAVFGQSPGGFLTTLAAPAGLPGLAGQVIFGLMPVVLLVVRRR